ncbi:hypothetical protein ABEB36_014775 [Hypothenemus hampei]|uniref:Regulatory protein zeste n=1 Tax=Hypothenemus hampei TaxID=57062 RepID=A0ABD1E7F5_HYPHA
MSAFTVDEKNLLIFLIDQNKHFIENKKTDANTNRAKAEIWSKITTAFNSRFSARTEKQLKKLWDNMKNKTRKIDTEHKKEMLKTGGGPPIQQYDDSISERVRSIVPTINFEIQNVFDSNYLPQEENSDPIIASTSSKYKDSDNSSTITI